ncbi:MAG: hypothetical protein ACKO9Z_15985 [Planctomycetota bacterium]
MALNRCAKRPGIHPVGANTHGATATAGAKRQDLKESVNESGEISLGDKPIQLRPVSSKIWFGDPAIELDHGGRLDIFRRLNFGKPFANGRGILHSFMSFVATGEEEP